MHIDKINLMTVLLDSPESPISISPKTQEHSARSPGLLDQNILTFQDPCPFDLDIFFPASCTCISSSKSRYHNSGACKHHTDHRQFSSRDVISKQKDELQQTPIPEGIATSPLLRPQTRPIPHLPIRPSLKLQVQRGDPTF